MTRRVAIIIESKDRLNGRGHLALHRASGTCILGLARQSAISTTGALSILRMDLTPSEVQILIDTGHVDAIL